MTAILEALPVEATEPQEPSGGVVRFSPAQPQVQAIGYGVLDRFISYLDSSPKTVQTYYRAVKQMFKYFEVNGITRPTREDIIAYRDDLKASGHKPSTVQNYITATRLFFSWASQEGLYPNVADHIKGARISREHKKDYLTSSQVKDVLQQIDRTTTKGKRDYAIFALMITCGLRTIEVSRANVGDLRTHGTGTVLYVQGKGKEERTTFVKVEPVVERLIRDYLKTRKDKAETSPLFTSTSNNRTGSRLSTRSVSGLVKERLQEAGYDSERLTAHSLRHTAVTLALLQGRELSEVQQFARHASITTTMIYNHSLEQEKNGCASAISKAIF